jgi:ribosome-associated protein
VTASDRSLELTTLAAIAAAEKKAEQIVAIDVSEQLAITDVFLLCSASNDRQVKAIWDELIRLARAGVKEQRALIV